MRRLRAWLFGAAVVLLSVWTLVPIYLITIAAFGGPNAVYAWPKSFLPENLSAGTFMQFVSIGGIWQATAQSVKVALLTVIFSVGLGAPAGYALARFRFRGAGTFRLGILLTRAFPVGILALPLALTFVRLGLYDSALGVALIHTALALPFAVLVTASLFVGIPRDLEEAAVVFGCSRAGAFRRVALPLAMPGIAATAVFSFVLSWNEVFAAAVLTLRHRTLTAFLLTVLSESPLHVQLAGGFLLIVPSIVFIFLVRRYLFAMWGIAGG
ncbi:MAG TPA: carbohydrate ABC transporter permease [Acetobacteraceae bacterium]|nr:carbohydrate ABC transporter permease [Acetobacteraceae bacterium]